jgi:hypothetical protein
MLEIQMADQTIQDENEIDENSMLQMPTNLSNYAQCVPEKFDTTISEIETTVAEYLLKSRLEIYRE